MSEAAAPKPLGVRLLIWLFWFWAGAIVLLLVGLGFGDGPVMVGGRPVPRAEAFTGMLPVLLPVALAVAGAALALGMRRSWARPAALLPFVLVVLGPRLVGVGPPSARDAWPAAAVLLPVLGALTWYLYFRPGPRAYFGDEAS